MNVGIFGYPPQGNATGWKTPKLTAYATPGTYTYIVPASVSRILLEAWGGGGNANVAGAAFASGGAGGYGLLSLAVNPGDVLTIVCGGSAAASTVTNAAGTVVLTANPGTSGTLGVGGTGGTATGGDLNLPGGNGFAQGTQPIVNTPTAYAGPSQQGLFVNGLQPGGGAVSTSGNATTGGAGLVNLWEPGVANL